MLFCPIFSFKKGETFLGAESLPISGYDGSFIRTQIGIAYGELLEDYQEDDRKYYAHGPHFGLQAGWAMAKRYALHFNFSGFFSTRAFGPERQERVDDTFDRTEHDYYFGEAGIGFTWFHVPSAVYFSPVINLAQVGRRIEEQRIHDRPAGSGESSLIRVETTYSNRIGYGIIIGNDRWVSESLGMGISLSVYQSHFLMEKQKHTITIEPTGEEESSIESDLQRVSARNLLFALSLNFTFN